MSREKTPVVIVEKKENVAYLTLNRPDVLNALSFELLTELKNELEKIRQDENVKGVFIRGAGEKAFSAGADVAFFHSASPLEVRELAKLAISVNNLLENLGKVSIALINGFALGGGLELAESCMLRVAVESARFGHPEVRIGVVKILGDCAVCPGIDFLFEELNFCVDGIRFGVNFRVGCNVYVEMVTRQLTDELDQFICVEHLHGTADT